MANMQQPYIPPNIRAVFRRTLLVTTVVAVVGVIVLAVFGLWLWALFGVVGLGLGVLNLWLVQRAAAGYADREGSGKKGSAVGVLGRLVVASVVALACAFVFRPQGAGAVAGLALFQIVSVFVSASPMVKEMRQW